MYKKAVAPHYLWRITKGKDIGLWAVAGSRELLDKSIAPIASVTSAELPTSVRYKHFLGKSSSIAGMGDGPIVEDVGITVTEAKGRTLQSMSMGDWVSTAAAPEALALSGQVRYEVTLDRLGPYVQLGWAAPGFPRTADPTSTGTGDDALSWGQRGTALLQSARDKVCVTSRNHSWQQWTPEPLPQKAGPSLPRPPSHRRSLILSFPAGTDQMLQMLPINPALPGGSRRA